MPAAFQAHVPGEAQGPAASGGRTHDQLHAGVAGLQQGGQGEYFSPAIVPLSMALVISEPFGEPRQADACCSVANLLDVMENGSDQATEEALCRWLVDTCARLKAA